MAAVFMFASALGTCIVLQSSQQGHLAARTTEYKARAGVWRLKQLFDFEGARYTLKSHAQCSSGRSDVLWVEGISAIRRSIMSLVFHLCNHVGSCI